LNKEKDKKMITERFSIINLIAAIIIILIIIFGLKIFIIEVSHIPSNSMEPTIHEHDKIVVAKCAYHLGLPKKNSIIASEILNININSPKAGDIVVFDIPHYAIQSELTLKGVKRVYGTPNDVIELKNNLLYFNKEKTYYNYDSSLATITRNNYLPSKIVVPFIGMKADFDEADFLFYYNILLDEGAKIKNYNGEWLINGEKYQNYKFKKNYYFLLGDNIEESYDSRFWGLISEDYIYGKVIYKF